MNSLTEAFRSRGLCRSLAFGTWTLLAVGFVLGQFAFLGWVGPAPVFLLWTAVAVPVLGLTGWWLRANRIAIPWRSLVAVAVAWLWLLAVAVQDPFVELRGLVTWAAFLGMLLLPLLVTYAVLARVEDGASVGGTA